MSELEKERVEIENNIIPEQMNHPELSEEEITFFIEQFRNLDTTKLKHRQRLVDVFVNSIYLYDDYKKRSSTQVFELFGVGFANCIYISDFVFRQWDFGCVRFADVSQLDVMPRLRGMQY